MINLEDYMIPCLNKKLFGIDCPGCGMQRSVSLITKGEFVDAFYMYPAIYTLIIMLVFLIFHLKFKFENGHRILLVLFVINFIFILTNYILKFI
ncbi:DUF2752 domain-containing protein [Siansivirga zeaxanthinifaciens]|uniref:DUF2752 domain-containing protein n=1 Tax=Siansivirga zeaxanthinifaciens TaxID=762954 RepID=UPI0005CBFD01|nr:DUF2752 domain-containing protein [Siansivirga zeaxanthinifaciens]